jgi:hypothetical protein
MIASPALTVPAASILAAQVSIRPVIPLCRNRYSSIRSGWASLRGAKTFFIPSYNIGIPPDITDTAEVRHFVLASGAGLLAEDQTRIGRAAIAHTIDNQKRYVYLRNVFMEIPKQTARGVFILVFGVAMSVIGIYMARVSWTRTTGIGLFLIGFGLGALGITNGFSDQSPLGRLLFKLGLIAFCVGVPLGAYAFYNGAF